MLTLSYASIIIQPFSYSTPIMVILVATFIPVVYYIIQFPCVSSFVCLKPVHLYLQVPCSVPCSLGGQKEICLVKEMKGVGKDIIQKGW